MKEKIVKHHRWLKIKISDCPNWLKNAVKKYESQHKPLNQIVYFKGRHFRYKVDFDNLDGKYKVQRRLRRKHAIKNTKQDGKAKKIERSALGTLGEGRMNEKQFLEFCGVSINDDSEKIKNSLLWQTVGKNGNSLPHWKKSIDCDTDHLENIIYNVPRLFPITKKVILSILQDRSKKEKLSIKEIKLKIENWKDEGYDVSELEKLLEEVK